MLETYFNSAFSLVDFTLNLPIKIDFTIPNFQQYLDVPLGTNTTHYKYVFNINSSPEKDFAYDIVKIQPVIKGRYSKLELSSMSNDLEYFVNKNKDGDIYLINNSARILDDFKRLPYEYVVFEGIPYEYPRSFIIPIKPSIPLVMYNQADNPTTNNCLFSTKLQIEGSPDTLSGFYQVPDNKKVLDFITFDNSVGYKEFLWLQFILYRICDPLLAYVLTPFLVFRRNCERVKFPYLFDLPYTLDLIKKDLSNQIATTKELLISSLRTLNINVQPSEFTGKDTIVNLKNVLNLPVIGIIKQNDPLHYNKIKYMLLDVISMINISRCISRPKEFTFSKIQKNLDIQFNYIQGYRDVENFDCNTYRYVRKGHYYVDKRDNPNPTFLRLWFFNSENIMPYLIPLTYPKFEDETSSQISQ